MELIRSLLHQLQNQGKQLETSSILDVGCGKADLLICLRELGLENLVGVNLFSLSPEYFVHKRYVKEIFGDEVGKIKYIQCDVDNEQLSFPSESFDAILLVDVLEHLGNPGGVLKEISRLLKKDGVLCMRTPNCANLRNRIHLLFGKSPYHNLKGWVFDHRILAPNISGKKFQGHIREYTIAELKQLLNYFDLRLLHIRLYPAEHAPYHKIFLKIYNILEKLYPRFAYQILIVAIKEVSTDERMNISLCQHK